MEGIGVGNSGYFLLKILFERGLNINFEEQDIFIEFYVDKGLYVIFILFFSNYILNTFCFFVIIMFMI